MFGTCVHRLSNNDKADLTKAPAHLSETVSGLYASRRNNSESMVMPKERKYLKHQKRLRRICIRGLLSRMVSCFIRSRINRRRCSSLRFWRKAARCALASCCFQQDPSGWSNIILSNVAPPKLFKACCKAPCCGD